MQEQYDEAVHGAEESAADLGSEAQERAHMARWHKRAAYNCYKAGEQHCYSCYSPAFFPCMKARKGD